MKKINVKKTTTLGKNVIINGDVSIGENCSIGNNVTIYPNTHIGNNITIFDNTVLGRLPQSAGNISRKIINEYQPLTIGDYSIIGANCVLYSGSHIANNVLICDLSSIRESCKIDEFVVLGRGVMVQPETYIGARTRIMDMCHLPGDMIIEEDVFISAMVAGASENSLGRSKDEKSIPRSGPTIKKGAYIGLGAKLLPKVVIGQNSVVGAGAVVTKDVPELTLVMGTPAKFIRKMPPRI